MVMSSGLGMVSKLDLQGLGWSAFLALSLGQNILRDLFHIIFFLKSCLCNNLHT